MYQLVTKKLGQRHFCPKNLKNPNFMPKDNTKIGQKGVFLYINPTPKTPKPTEEDLELIREHVETWGKPGHGFVFRKVFL